MKYRRKRTIFKGQLKTSDMKWQGNAARNNHGLLFRQRFGSLMQKASDGYENCDSTQAWPKDSQSEPAESNPGALLELLCVVSKRSYQL